MFKNNNPMFNSVNINYDEVSENQATYGGVTIKTLFLLGVTGIAGIISGLGLYNVTNYAALSSILVLCSILGLISVIIGRNSLRYSKFFGVLYSVCEGVLLGTVTCLADMFYEGIALLAILGTAAVFLICLLMFACGAMRNTSKLSSILMTMFFSIIFISLILTICAVFNVPGISTILYDNFMVAIIVELLFIVYGSIALFLNFNEVTYYVKSGADKNFEWIASFGLLVSILYIYLEILRLLMYILGRKD